VFDKAIESLESILLIYEMFWVPWWYPKKSIIHEIAVMKHENHICEEDSMALSTHLGTMTVPKNILEEQCEI